jgi:acylphosphatase
LTDATARLHAIVHGRVQAVGYRYFVVDEAQLLRLTGWVRNLPDGSVEALAEGPVSALELLLAALERGPRNARVSEVVGTWEKATGEFLAFGIRRF